jgi:hypothetical protein
LSCNRATVQYDDMNVTLKLSDELCREARHRAVDESKSLSAWVADLVARAVGPTPSPAPATLLSALGDESLADAELDRPNRRAQPKRPVKFP